MTREEIKEYCKKQIETCEKWAKARGENPCGKIYEEHKMILELLEQEPCEDAISRQAVLDEINRIGVKGFETYNDYSQLYDFVDTFPPVTPQPKTIHEKQADSEKYQKAYDDGYEGGYAQARFDFEPKTGHWRHYEGMLICSECETKFYDDIMEYCGDDVPKCCPNCGAKMKGENNE